MEGKVEGKVIEGEVVVGKVSKVFDSWVKAEVVSSEIVVKC